MEIESDLFKKPAVRVTTFAVLSFVSRRIKILLPRVASRSSLRIIKVFPIRVSISHSQWAVVEPLF
jgi:hypothetical protein